MCVCVPCDAVAVNPKSEATCKARKKKKEKSKDEKRDEMTWKKIEKEKGKRARESERIE